VLFDRKHAPYVQNYIAGLGGRDVTVQNFTEMVDSVDACAQRGDPMGYEIINLKE
jgi:pyruvate ferredoxin oxidoreductase alpha subunit